MNRTDVHDAQGVRGSSPLRPTRYHQVTGTMRARGTWSEAQLQPSGLNVAVVAAGRRSPWHEGDSPAKDRSTSGRVTGCGKDPSPSDRSGSQERPSTASPTAAGSSRPRERATGSPTPSHGGAQRSRPARARPGPETTRSPRYRFRPARATGFDRRSQNQDG